jgi:uncharacterized Rossmann fold enzyme
MIYDTKDSPFKKYEKMDFSLSIWLEFWYPQICKFLEISSKKDELALKEVLDIVKSNMFSEELKATLLRGNKALVVAPGERLEEEFESYLPTVDKEDTILISANGATSFLLKQGFIPHVIVTDLDGNLKDQFEAQKAGSILLIHVHSDNLSTIKENIDNISKNNFIFTTQTEPLPGSYNFYGFTDGDRAVCMSSLMKVKKIFLSGFDFGPVIGKYSKQYQLNEEMKERKMKKFQIAKSIINWCANTGQKIFIK